MRPGPRTTLCPTVAAVTFVVLLAATAAPALAQGDAEGPTVRIEAPEDGATLATEDSAVDVPVRLEARGAGLGAGDDPGVEGPHVHLYLYTQAEYRELVGEDEAVRAEGPPAPALRAPGGVGLVPTGGAVDAQPLVTTAQWVEVDREALTVLDVPPGEYVLLAVAVEGEHAPVEPVAAAVSEFTVAEAAGAADDGGLEPPLAPEEPALLVGAFAVVAILLALAAVTFWIRRGEA